MKIPLHNIIQETNNNKSIPFKYLRIAKLALGTAGFITIILVISGTSTSNAQFTVHSIGFWVWHRIHSTQKYKLEFNWSSRTDNLPNTQPTRTAGRQGMIHRLLCPAHLRGKKNSRATWWWWWSLGRIQWSRSVSWSMIARGKPKTGR